MYLTNYLRKSLITICGATATGKSGLALSIAQRLNSVILSADSRQVYREFDIGTAKPTAAQQQLVPHYLIDICDPTETLTVADYQQQAQALIEKRQEVRGEGQEVRGESPLVPPSPCPPLLFPTTSSSLLNLAKSA